MVMKIKKEKLLLITKYKMYLDVLINKKIMRHIMKRIQSKLHKTGTYDVS